MRLVKGIVFAYPLQNSSIGDQLKIYILANSVLTLRRRIVYSSYVLENLKNVSSRIVLTDSGQVLLTLAVIYSLLNYIHLR